MSRRKLPRRDVALVFEGRGTCRPCVKLVAAALGEELPLKIFRGGPASAATEACSRVETAPSELALFCSYKGYEKAIEACDCASVDVPVVSRIRGFEGLCDKVALTDLLTASGRRSFRWIPQSCVLPRDSSDLQTFIRESAADNAGALILKPSDGAKGSGITVFPLPQGVQPQQMAQRIVASCNKGKQGGGRESSRPTRRPSWLLQRYVSAPLLLFGRKFDLRLYLLVVKEGGEGDAGEGGRVRAFCCHQGLARLCSEPYAPPTAANAGCDRVHLTNFAVNKGSSSSSSSSSPSNATLPLKLTARDALRQIEEAEAENRLEGKDRAGQRSKGARVGDGADPTSARRLWEGARQAARDVSLALAPRLLLQGCSSSSSSSNGSSSRAREGLWRDLGRDLEDRHHSHRPRRRRRCRFQLAGLDIMFDSSGAAVVLELNANPSLDITGPDGKTVCATDRDVKVPMLRDALRIAVLQEDPTAEGASSQSPPLCWEQVMEQVAGQ